jgi:lipoprotein NlpD
MLAGKSFLSPCPQFYCGVQMRGVQMRGVQMRGVQMRGVQMRGVHTLCWQKWVAVILLIAIACLSGCSNNVRAPVSDSPLQGYHQVSRGETLYSIAFRYGLDYRNIAKLNHLPSPYKIHPNQKLRLNALTPKKLAKPRIKKHASIQQKPIRSIHAPNISPIKPTHVIHSIPKTSSKIVWHWPTRGTIISSFTPSVAGNKGIDIAGTYGQAIYAAAPGYVVYCGNGLRGYGQLIVIKHNEEYLSAYAHNSVLLVKEGMFVRAGQLIAKMGNSDSSRIKLHFEIRYAGKPINPLNYLPKN